MTTTINHNKANMSINVNKEITADYKIYMIINTTTKEYYISQTTNKYLSTCLSDMKRRKSKLTEHLFIGDCDIVLLEVMQTNNLHFVKNRVNELIKIKKAETDTTSIKNLDGRGKHIKEKCDECEEVTEDEEEDTEDSEEEDIKPKKELPKYKCLCCDKDEYVKNKKRHEKTNKHIANDLKYNKK